MPEIKKKNMVILGSAGRNSGKTLLACKIIEHYSHQYPIIGIKVTTIQKKDETCPRGGEGCGVCSSLEGAYYISEEQDRNSKKDTSRLLASGAWKVFWLRVLKDHLIEGIEALFEIIPKEAALVCESNSLRTVIKPGIFLLVKDKNQNAVKPSAQKVQKFADRLVEFDSEKLKDKPFDLDLKDIRFINSRWVLLNRNSPHSMQ